MPQHFTGWRLSADMRAAIAAWALLLLPSAAYAQQSEQPSCLTPAAFEARMGNLVAHIHVPAHQLDAAVAFWTAAGPKPLPTVVDAARIHTFGPNLIVVAYENRGCVTGYIRTTRQVFGRFVATWATDTSMTPNG